MCKTFKLFKRFIAPSTYCSFSRTLRYAGDATNKDITAQEALILLPKVQAKLKESQKTIKLQRGQIKRLRDKLENMQQIINKLNSKHFLSDTGSSVLQVTLSVTFFFVIGSCS